MERRRFPDETDEARIDPAELGVTETSEEPSLLEEDLFAHADPRIFVIDPDNPEEGRTFVWALTRWFERIEGRYGRRGIQPRGRGRG